jgi:hypothetical protein
MEHSFEDLSPASMKNQVYRSYYPQNDCVNSPLTNSNPFSATMIDSKPHTIAYNSREEYFPPFDNPFRKIFS